MFKQLMNNYYYGKAGKGDLTPDDLPSNRWQLFWETLRVRFSALVRLNVMYLVAFIPVLIVLGLGVSGTMNILNSTDLGDGESAYTMQAALQAESTAEQGGDPATVTVPAVMSAAASRDALYSILFMSLLLFIPAFAITGPATAGVSYVVRNWARDEHAFIWSDFKDAMKENWKQSIVISLITSVLPIIVYMCWRFYGELANTNVIMIVPQILVMMLGLVWAISVTFMHPMIVGYRLTLKDLLRNSMLLAVARLPQSVGIRLLHCVPVLIALAVAFFINPAWAILGIVLYYILIGFSLSRFVTASFTNAVFDRYINSHIEGAKVNRGLREENDDDDEEEISVEMPRE